MRRRLRPAGRAEVSGMPTARSGQVSGASTPASPATSPDAMVTPRQSSAEVGAGTTTEVTAVNDPPTADDQAVLTSEDTPVAVTLTASDPDGDPLTYSVVTGPTNGSLSGAAAGCLLVLPPPPTKEWAEPAEWRKIDCEMGAPGLEVEAA